MGKNKIDLLNTVLILFSLIVSYKIPFELFLIAYAVLGPLHYLTEINWLEKKSFFVEQKKWMWLFLVLTILTFIPFVFQIDFLRYLLGSDWLKEVIIFLEKISNNLLIGLLLFAIGLVMLKKHTYILLVLLLSFVCSFYFLPKLPETFVYLSVFIPTILHVYVFTVLFMLAGSVNTKSKIGYINVALVLIIPLYIYARSIDVKLVMVSAEMQKIYTDNNFLAINWYLAKLFNQIGEQQFLVLSVVGIKTQIFISFCYTYHYLNWFSKTSVIGWNKNVSKLKIGVTLCIWIAAMALYAYSYRIGLLALFCLSFLHVVLEFPLNILSIKNIVLGLKKLNKN